MSAVGIGFPFTLIPSSGIAALAGERGVSIAKGRVSGLFSGAVPLGAFTLAVINVLKDRIAAFLKEQLPALIDRTPVLIERFQAIKGQS